LVLAWWSVDALKAQFATSVANVSIPKMDNVHVDLGVLLFTLGLSVLTGIGFGVVPAIHAAREGLAEKLREGGRSSTEGRRNRRLRSALVVSEVALALVLTTGAALLVKSFVNLTEGQLGFDPQDVMTARVQLSSKPDKYPSDDRKRAFFEQT